MQKLPLRFLSIVTLVAFLFSTLVTPVAAAMTYTYDPNGNMTSDGTQCYEYTEANQLKTVKRCSNNQTIAEYVYDYQGNRIVKKEYENGTLKNTVYSPDDEFEKKIKASDNSVQNTTYYKTNGEFLARKNPDGTKVYYHNDHLGSNSVLTDQSGNLVEKTAYEPYGEVKSGGTQSKFQYTGQEKDQETGLNYYGARYYSSHIQRFTQPDTILENVYDPQLLNRYSYVRNNPLRYTDPSGHCIGPIVFACIGILIEASPFLAAGTLYVATHPEIMEAVVYTGVGVYDSYDSFQQGDFKAGTTSLLFAGVNAKGLKSKPQAGKGDLNMLQEKKVVNGKATKDQIASFQKQLDKNGKASLEKSRKSIEKRLNEHERKLVKYKEAGGYTSSVEREIRNFKNELDAINKVLNKKR